MNNFEYSLAIYFLYIFLVKHLNAFPDFSFLYNCKILFLHCGEIYMAFLLFFIAFNKRKLGYLFYKKINIAVREFSNMLFCKKVLSMYWLAVHPDFVLKD